MRPLRCVVVDDEPLAATLIKSYVEKTPNLQLAGTFNQAQDAVRTIMAGDIDLVFLDIEMQQLNGIEFAHIIPATTRIGESRSAPRLSRKKHHSKFACHVKAGIRFTP